MCGHALGNLLEKYSESRVPGLGLISHEDHVVAPVVFNGIAFLPLDRTCDVFLSTGRNSEDLDFGLTNAGVN